MSFRLLPSESLYVDVRRYALHEKLIPFYVLLGLFIAAYWPTLASIVSIWWRSETFTHGFLVVPIVLMITWQLRNRLNVCRVQWQASGLIIILGLSLVWLLARLVDVAVVQQFSVVGLIPALVWTAFGSQVTGVLSFPLAFLFLTVPFGEFLIPSLQDFTAIFTVKFLQWFGMPVYWEGRFFHIPSGTFEVAKACSGIRYLIASVCLGVLFAYLNYSSKLKQAVFVALSILVPVIANGLRAVGIVLLAHMTDQKFGMGVDHLIYGWFFFGLVIFGLFWIGSYFRDDTVTMKQRATQELLAQDKLDSEVSLTRRRWLVVSFLLLSGPALLVWTRSAAQTERNIVLSPPLVSTGTLLGPNISDGIWHAEYKGVSSEYLKRYGNNDRWIDVYVGYYERQKQDAELINSENSLYDTDKWRRISERREVLRASDGTPWTLNATVLESAHRRMALWYWYEIAGEKITNPLIAKLHEAKNKLLRKQAGVAVVILTFPLAKESDTPQVEQRKQLNRLANEVIRELYAPS